MCNYERPVKFLDAMKFKKDDAFVTCTYLNMPESVFTADIYCHRTCFMQYLTNSLVKTVRNKLWSSSN